MFLQNSSSKYRLTLACLAVLLLLVILISAPVLSDAYAQESVVIDSNILSDGDSEDVNGFLDNLEEDKLGIDVLSPMDSESDNR